MSTPGVGREYLSRPFAGSEAVYESPRECSVTHELQGILLEILGLEDNVGRGTLGAAHTNASRQGQEDEPANR